MRRHARAWCALAALLPVVAAQAKPPPEPGIRHPILAAQSPLIPDEAILAVEIPASSSIKYEIGTDGLVHVDRFLSMPVVYPANYGAMPRTLAGDGDPLDALVLTRAPLSPGVLIRFRPIGVLRMTDAGQADEKIIGVPTATVDPDYAEILTLDDLPAMERARIDAFFRAYKQLPQGTDSIAINGYGDAEEARAVISAALRRFNDTAGQASAP